MTTKKLTRGIRNNNPGNIDRQPGVRWQGQSADQANRPINPAIPASSFSTRRNGASVPSLAC